VAKKIRMPVDANQRGKAIVELVTGNRSPSAGGPGRSASGLKLSHYRQPQDVRLSA